MDNGLSMTTMLQYSDLLGADYPTRDILPDDFFNRLPEDIREELNSRRSGFRSEKELREYAAGLIQRA